MVVLLVMGRHFQPLTPTTNGHRPDRHVPEKSSSEADDVAGAWYEWSATLVAGDERFELRPGMMVRVGSEQLRRILPGPAGVRIVALSGVPGTFDASPWTQLGGPLPVPA